MGILTGIGIAILGIILILTIRSMTTFFHELGHAIPALLFTDERVTVYIGSYGDINNALRFNLGRLELIIKFMILDWKIGMCSYSGSMKLWQHIVVIIGGPVASLFISIPLIFLLRNYEIDAVYQTLIFVFMLAALVDFVLNLVPISRSIQMHDGSIMYNDGTQLLQVLRRSSLPEAYFQLEKEYQQGDIDQVISRGVNLINDGITDKPIYDLTIKALLDGKEYVAALALYEQMSASYKLSYDDFKQVGKIQHKLNNTDSALKYFNHCLHLDYMDAEVLMDKGVILLERAEYEKALESFDQARHYAPKDYQPRLHRAHANIKLKNYEAARIDLESCSTPAAEDPYLYFYWGMYYEGIDQFEKALSNYEKAEAMNIDHHGIEFRIATVTSYID